MRWDQVVGLAGELMSTLLENHALLLRTVSVINL